jgi:hypothetical protein
MKTYPDIDAFLEEAFPLECRKIERQRPGAAEEEIDNINSSFAEKLENIIKGNKPCAALKAAPVKGVNHA